MSSPSLVGGIALRAYDLPAATVFAAAYGLLIPVLVYRVFDKRWRSIILFQVISFVTERTVMFSLRAALAAHPNTETTGLSEWMQIVLALGYLNLAEILLKLVRAVLVNSTKGTPASDSTPPSVGVDHSSHKKCLNTPNVDDPRRRFWYRRWSEFLLMLYLLALVVGIVATVHLLAAKNSGPAHRALRYVSSAIGLTLTTLELYTILWTWKKVPRIDRRVVWLLLPAAILLTIPPHYRLVALYSTTPDIHALDHAALNTPGDKAAFYVLHILPEFIVAFLFGFFNVKDICQTGVVGDQRWRDETPNEREKREMKEAKKNAEARNTTLELQSQIPATSTGNENGATLA